MDEQNAIVVEDAKLRRSMRPLGQFLHWENEAR
jgi:hypothetical protein